MTDVTVFGSEYAIMYDRIYETKAYDRECQLVQDQFALYGAGTRAILDVGCGTGNHALRLAAKGYRVCGVEPSAAMLEIARRKSMEHRVDVEWVEGRLQSVDHAVHHSNRARAMIPFDAAILMSTILGYVATNHDIMVGLRSLRALLRPGAVVVADLWYGPAVMAKGPSTRFKTYNDGDATLFRVSEGAYDVDSQIYRTDITAWRMRAQEVTTLARESHEIRVFFPQELRLLLGWAGFKVAALRSFPDGERAANTSTWPVVVVAVAE